MPCPPGVSGYTLNDIHNPLDGCDILHVLHVRFFEAKSLMITDFDLFHVISV